ncbi:hypothetical protein AYX15_07073 [Cryptococcus neoformans]|nr:hypothetical protein AYX15_07073 [Cryptococcus neoformans var. grubii]
MSKPAHLINSSRRIPPMCSPSYSMLFRGEKKAESARTDHSKP